MNDILFILAIAFFSGLLTYLGAPLAEWLTVSQRVVSGVLQLAAGIIVGLVALTLMPPAVQGGPPRWVVLAFFVGGAGFVLFEYLSAQRLAANPRAGSNVTSLGLSVGILVALVVDGMVIGIGATQARETGVLLALGLGFEGALLAFVSTATAKQQGMSKAGRRRLSLLYFLTVVGGIILGYLLLRNQSQELQLVLIALVSGFLITTVTQSMIPAANREGEPSFAGIFFVGGLSLYALLKLAVDY